MKHPELTPEYDRALLECGWFQGGDSYIGHIIRDTWHHVRDYPKDGDRQMDKIDFYLDFYLSKVELAPVPEVYKQKHRELVVKARRVAWIRIMKIMKKYNIIPREIR